MRQGQFFTVKIECPVCGNKNEFEPIKAGAHTEAGQDTDFCPAGRAWTDRAYEKYNPLPFNFATCRKCYYGRELNGSYAGFLQGVREHWLEVPLTEFEALGRSLEYYLKAYGSGRKVRKEYFKITIREAQEMTIHHVNDTSKTLNGRKIPEMWNSQVRISRTPSEVMS